MKEQCEIDLKIQLFFNFVANFWDKRRKEDWRISLLSPGKLGIFLLLAIFSTHLSQKLGTSTQLKPTFSNKY